MIKEHNQQLKSTAGATKQLPQQVHRLLATHACKGKSSFFLMFIIFCRVDFFISYSFASPSLYQLFLNQARLAEG